MFRKPALLPSSGNEAPNVVNPLDKAILFTGSTMLGAFYLKMESEPASETSCFLESFRRWTKCKKKKKNKIMSGSHPPSSKPYNVEY
jgi:hypothetical protein